MMHRVLCIVCFLLLIECVTGCNLIEDVDVSEGDDVPSDMSVGVDAARPDTSSCMPETCETVEQVCGVVEDGCGGTLTCTSCVEALEVAPQMLTLAPGERAFVVARAVDASGDEVIGVEPTWLSQSERIATVDERGAVDAIAVGGTTITARVGDVIAVIDVKVARAEPAQIRINPSPAQVHRYDSLQVGLVWLDAEGIEVAAPQDPVVEWSVDPPAIASIDADGVITGSARGVGTITASAQGFEAMAPLLVTHRRVASLRLEPPTLTLSQGESSRLEATAYDADGEVVMDVSVGFTSADVAIATVGDQGKVTGVMPGSVRVEAVADGQTNYTDVTVVQTRVARLEITTDPVQKISTGQTVQLSAQAYDANDQPVPCTVTWSTQDAAIATIDMQGLAVGQAPGTTDITAACEGSQDTVSLTVTETVGLPIPALLWLMADKGVQTAPSSNAVTSWQGQGSGAYLAKMSDSAKQPTLRSGALNGLPVIEFHGGDYLNMRNAQVRLTDGVIFVVAKNNAAGRSGQLVAGCQAANMQFRFESDVQSMFAYGFDAAGSSLTFSIRASGAKDTTARHRVVALEIDSAAKATLYQSGTPLDSASVTLGSVMHAFRFNQIGARCSNASESLRGEIAEVIAFDTLLTPAQRAQVEMYLTMKYGL